MQQAKVLKEHEFLEDLVGVWDVTAPEMTGQEPWTEIVRSLHGIWFVAERSGQMPGGGAATTLLTLGYSADKGKYVGTWIGTMMDHLWVYQGEVSGDGKVLNLYTTGPDVSDATSSPTTANRSSFMIAITAHSILPPASPTVPGSSSWRRTTPASSSCRQRTACRSSNPNGEHDVRNPW